MSVAIENFTDFRYGIVAGPVFTIIFATLNLCSGTLADKMSRKNLVSIAAICWSLTTVGTAFTHTFAMVCFYRTMLGVFEAFCGPISYSLIVDFFPPENRTIANSIYSFGIFAGAGLASITVLIIGWIGWRGAYLVVATFGILAGVMSFIFIKEPIRGRFEI
jgi:MFS family permease